MNIPANPRYIFSGLFPTLEEIGACDRIAHMVSAVMRRVGVEVDALEFIREGPSPFGVFVIRGAPPVSDAAGVKFFSLAHAQLAQCLPRVTFGTTHEVILGATRQTDSQLARKIEGPILHEAFHALSAREPISAALKVYCAALEEFQQCASALRSCRTEMADAIIAKHFSSKEAFASAIGQIKEAICVPFERALTPLSSLGEHSVELADRFSKNPLELLPQEQMLQNHGIAFFEPHKEHFDCLKRLTAELKDNAAAMAYPQAANLAPEAMRLDKMGSTLGEWRKFLKRYDHAIEFACDEFAQANEHHPDSMRNFLSSYLRSIIREVAHEGSATLSREQVDAIETALKEFRELDGEMEEVRRRAYTFASHIGTGNTHPNPLARFQRLERLAHNTGQGSISKY